MHLPKPMAILVCATLLGAQLWAAFPVTKEKPAWYWPFLPYPMYSASHARGDSLMLPELRATGCADTAEQTTFDPSALGTPRSLFSRLLLVAGRGADDSAGVLAQVKLTRVIEAHYPRRFCTASAWKRTVFIADTSTHHMKAGARQLASWRLPAAQP